MNSLRCRSQCISELESQVFSDLNTLEVAGGTRRSFPITQCKAADGEGKELDLLDGASQLLRYLSMQHQNRRAPRRPCGILDRKKVRFFQYDRVRG